MKQTWNVEGTSYRIPRDHKPIALVYDPTPGGRKNEDGTTTHSLRFPALILTDIVSDGEKIAQQIADELNAFPKVVEALKDAEAAIAGEIGDKYGALLERIKAALPPTKHDHG